MKRLTKLVFVFMLLSAGISAQTTEFSFQGSLKDGASAANGNYDFEFALFDAVSGGAQLGSTLTQNNVAVANGIFSVKLDFGSQFPGANRFLEIRVRLSGQPGITTLAPRQQVNSSPYAVKSLTSANATNAGTATTANNATQLGGVAANQYVVTTDPRMTDPRAPTAGSTNYVQNSTVLQSATNFNISGNGTAGGTLRGDVIRADTGFNIGLNRVVSVAGTNNTFVGALNGDANTTGTDNSFFGRSAGTQNTSGSSNSFFGSSAGFSNTTGAHNTFVGRSSGESNNANDNSFFGYFAGSSNTSGINNSFFGANAGESNTIGVGNSFFGRSAGTVNTDGSNNAFFGAFTGASNTTGSANSFFGRLAGSLNTTGASNSFFGHSSGGSNATGSSNSFYGVSSGQANVDGFNNSFFGVNAGRRNISGNNNSFYGFESGFENTTGTLNSFFGNAAGQNNTTASGNSFFGYAAGFSTNTGGANSFFGREAGTVNNIGTNNASFGFRSGNSTTSGSGNAFFGSGAGGANTTGGNNTIIGENADVATGGLNYATAIGSDSVASLSNSVYLGRPGGQDAVRIPGATIIDGSLVVNTLGGTTGNVHLCLNTSNRLAGCTINFAEPNLVEELRKVNESQQKQITEQQQQINALKKLVCLTNKDADLCKE